jgi:hypothetical protein
MQDKRGILLLIVRINLLHQDNLLPNQRWKELQSFLNLLIGIRNLFSISHRLKEWVN